MLFDFLVRYHELKSENRTHFFTSKMHILMFLKFGSNLAINYVFNSTFFFKF